MIQQWQELYAQRMRSMKSSAIRELLKVTEQPEVISFAGGLPAPELFPLVEVAQATDEILRTHGTQALQYGPTEGYTPLREQLARQFSTPDIPIAPENVLITVGSQQALDLLGKIFFDPGDVVLVEAPTYLGAMQAWSSYGVQYVSVPVDEQGMIVEQLEAILQRVQPKLIYVMPNFQNPAGVRLSLARREQLVELAHRYAVPLVEDDAYARLCFNGDVLPSLFQLSGRRSNPASGHVCYLGTFSKILSPGLRVGWVIAPAEVISKLVQAKQGVDLHTPMLNQMIAYHLTAQEFMEGHIERIRHVYRQRRDVMLDALQRHFPATVSWTRPEGGMFLWLTLPPEIDTEEMLREAIMQKVVFVPGHAFYAQGGGRNSMRLNFSNTEPERIEQGIERLSQVLQARWQRV